MIKTQQMLRRDFMKKAGKYLVTAPFLTLTACNETTSVANSDTETDISTSDSTASDSSSTSTTTTTSSADSWATGGTDSMTVAKTNPFADGSYSTCTVTKSTTEGPCYANTETREDITEGLDGLPVRMCLRVVDSSCSPVSGVVVDIWHCDTVGIYSSDGMDARGVDFCSDGSEEYANENFYRGTQTTDANGLVYFSTNFPGWYSGRAVHIHFMVQSGNQTYITSQFGFEDSLVSEILVNESVYSSNGDSDTKNYNDNVFPSSGYEEYLLDQTRQSDGSMLAWKEIMLS